MQGYDYTMTTPMKIWICAMDNCSDHAICQDGNPKTQSDRFCRTHHMCITIVQRACASENLNKIVPPGASQRGTSDMRKCLMMIWKKFKKTTTKADMFAAVRSVSDKLGDATVSFNVAGMVCAKWDIGAMMSSLDEEKEKGIITDFQYLNTANLFKFIHNEFMPRVKHDAPE